MLDKPPVSRKVVSMDTLLRYFFIVVILGCTVCLILEKDSPADEDYMTGMLGVFNSAQKSKVETKFLNIGHRSDLGFGLSQQIEAGGWIDSAGGGRGSSGYGAYQIGVETDTEVQGRVMFGPAIITSPDIYLGGIFPQFTEDFYIGIKGHDGNTVGVKYKHISSAGLCSPNMGRDFAGVEIGIPF